MKDNDWIYVNHLLAYHHHHYHHWNILNNFLASKYHIAVAQPTFSEHFLNIFSDTSFVLDVLDNTQIIKNLPCCEKSCAVQVACSTLEQTH